MCEFHNSNSNGLGDIWWTDKCMYFSSIDYIWLILCVVLITLLHGLLMMNVYSHCMLN